MYGIKLLGHRFVGDKVILNEKEVRACHALYKDKAINLYQKASKLLGKVYSQAEIFKILNSYEQL